MMLGQIHPQAADGTVAQEDPARPDEMRTARHRGLGPAITRCCVLCSRPFRGRSHFVLEHKHLVVQTTHQHELPALPRKIVHLLLDQAQVSLEKPHVHEAILVVHGRSLKGRSLPADQHDKQSASSAAAAQVAVLNGRIGGTSPSPNKGAASHTDRSSITG
jgi:hypothetical protein